ncbi:MAG: AAA domain-containing protein [Byssovorax sp.]
MLGAAIVVITKIERFDEPGAMTAVPFLPIVLRPIQLEQLASAEVLLAYNEALQRLAEPPPIERPQAPPNTEESDGLFRYAAFAELLVALRRRSDRAPRVRVVGEVLVPGELDQAENLLRVATKGDLNDWRADCPVVCTISGGVEFRGSIHEIEGSVIELETPGAMELKPGASVVVEQIPRFAMAAHQRALKQFLAREVAGNWQDLRALIAEPEALEPDLAIVPEDSGHALGQLTDEQKSAVERAVSTPHTLFIQGPPGTGKTTVITEIVQRLVGRGERVLLLSSTNVAVDEVLRRIEKRDGVLPVRLTWNSAKVDADVRDYAYEHALRALVKKVLRPRQHREQVRVELEALGTMPDRIAQLRAIEDKWIREGQEPGAKDALENEIGEALLGAANLICATTVGVASKRFSHVGNVDTLIVDEASRVTDAEFLIGAVRARRWILVGDEHQLPPHVEPATEHFLLALMACALVERNLAADLPAAVEKLAQDWQEEEKQHAFRVDSVLAIAGPLLESNEWTAHYRFPFDHAPQVARRRR